MPIPVLIDTDAGIDDAIALALASFAPEVELVGVAAVGGNVPLQQAWVNLCRLADLFEWSPKLGMARGLDQIEPRLLDGRHKHGDDGLGGVVLPEPMTRRTPMDVVDLYMHAIDLYGRDLVIIAVGPLTNLSAVHAADARALRRCGSLVVMGGAVFTPGNMLDGQAEFNFYRDPLAAREFCEWPLARKLVPLDATLQVLFGAQEIARLVAAGDPVLSKLAEMLAWRVNTSGREPPASALHDALAVASVIQPSLLVDTEVVLNVRDESSCRGRVDYRTPAEGEPAVRVAVSADNQACIDLICSRLINRPRAA